MSERTFALSEDAFKILVENNQDIMAVCDADSRIRYASPSSREVLGYEQDDILGSPGLDMVHPEDRENVLACLNEFAKTPGARDSIQYRTRHANGTWVTFEVVAHNMLDHPAVRGVVISGRDITKRKPEPGPEQPSAGLQGLLPICSACKKIRDDAGKWKEVEVYFRDRTNLEFSHSMCPDCTKRWFPDHFKK